MKAMTLNRENIMFKFTPKSLLKKTILVPVIVAGLGLFGVMLPPAAVDGLALFVGAFI